MTGFRISDDLCAVLVPLIPEWMNSHRFGGGRPRVPGCACANAIFSVLCVGGPWVVLNETESCRKSTAHDPFSEWVAVGVFLKL